VETFKWVWKEIGVDSNPWRGEWYIPVPVGGPVLVMLRDAKGVFAPSGDGFLNGNRSPLKTCAAGVGEPC
jgi:hypothetical protein